MVSGADVDDETRVAKILADRWVHYPQGEAALTRMAELLRGARRTRMPSLLVVGEPDVGKTTILKKFMRAHAPIFDSKTGRTSSEVVAMEAPPEADEARLYLRGGQSDRKRREAMERIAAIPEQDERVIVATGRYLGEGFDDQRLDTLFPTMPIAWRGTLAQYAGRLHRLHDPKREVVIYDYVDRDVPVLARMAAKRAAGYSAIGYTTV